MSELLRALQRALGDRYLIERELGRGGMAVVLLAQDRKLQRPVAIKVLSPEVSSTVAAERFLREVRITAQLQHPNILPLLDSGRAAGLLYSVMPYVEGETLRDLLASGTPLPVADALFFARETAEALDYAHRRGIIHRDVKPENLLISNGHIIVADFGIARAVGLAGGSTLTGSGLPIGTAAYMSPEQVMSGAAVDARTDVYSLGCVLYEMLTGRMAFGGSNLREVLRRQVSGSPTPIAELRPDVPPAVEECVAKALAKNPDERYQTAGDMAQRLRELLGEPPRLPTPGEGELARLRPSLEAIQPTTERTGSRWGRWLGIAAVLALVALVATERWIMGAGGDRATGTVDAPDRSAVEEAYRRGSYWLERRTPEALAQARAAFSAAIAADSGFAPALAGLARARTLTVIYGYRTGEDPYTALSYALALADRAIAEDSMLGAAYAARAEAGALAREPPDSVVATARRALQLAPTAPDVQTAYALALGWSGAYDSALHHARAAVDANPLLPGPRFALIILALGARQFDLALQEARRARQLAATDPIAIGLEGYALLLGGRARECAARPLGPWLGLRAMCLRAIGRTAQSEATVDSAAAQLELERYDIDFQYAELAAALAWSGDAAGAVRWLERAVAHSPVLHFWQLDSGIFDRVRNDPEFEAGVERVRLNIVDRLRARRATLAG